MLTGALAAGILGDRLGIIPVIAVQGAGYCIAGTLVLLLLPTHQEDPPTPSTLMRQQVNPSTHDPRPRGRSSLPDRLAA